jgi:hypothetical protein
MKHWLYGDEGHEPTKGQVVALAEEVVKGDLLELLPAKLGLLDFETRKDAAQVGGGRLSGWVWDPEGCGGPGARSRSVLIDALRLFPSRHQPANRPTPTDSTQPNRPTRPPARSSAPSSASATTTTAAPARSSSRRTPRWVLF